MIILTMWRTDEEEYREKGNLNLSKEDILKSLVNLDAEELHQYFKQHTKIRQHVSNNGYRWEEDDLDTTDTSFLTTIIEEDLRPILSGREVWGVIAKLLKIDIVVYAPYDIINHDSEDFNKLCFLVKPLINKLDPMKLLDDDGEPDDEYSCEIGRIVGLLTVAKDLIGVELTADDLLYIVSGVFSGEQISGDDSLKCADAMVIFLQVLDEIEFFRDEENGNRSLKLSEKIWTQKLQKIIE